MGTGKSTQVGHPLNTLSNYTPLAHLQHPLNTPPPHYTILLLLPFLHYFPLKYLDQYTFTYDHCIILSYQHLYPLPLPVTPS